MESLSLCPVEPSSPPSLHELNQVPVHLRCLDLIREGKTHLLPNTIRTHGQSGMQTLDMALVELYRARSISWDIALAFSQDPVELEKLSREMGIRA